MKRAYSVLPVLIAAVFFAIIAQGNAAEYKGRIVDADTGEPIEGAVLNMEWTQRCPFQHGRFFDTRETLTDKDGFFLIKGPPMNFNPICSTNEEPYFIAYKAGYGPIRSSMWFKPHLIKYGFLQSDEVVLKLRKAVSSEDKIKSILGTRGIFPSKYQKLLIREINKERSGLKLETIPEVE